MNPVTIDRKPVRERPVSETVPGSVACCRCSHDNPRERRFCSQCGSSLWLPCPACSLECAVTESFCGECGANLEHTVRQRSDDYAATLAKAETARQARNYQQALELLWPLSKLQDPRFHRFHDQARELTGRIENEFERARGEADRACKAAQQRLLRHDYQGARTELESVPEQMRNQRAVDLLREACARDDEVRRLSGEVARSVKAGELTGLGIKLERLLVLQPDHEIIRRLAIQFRTRQIRSAQARLADHDYEQALAMLDAIPLSQWNEEVEKIKSEAAELDWLSSDLKHAAIADKTLLAIAERLVKLRPADDEAAQLAQRVRSAMAKPPRDPRAVAANLSAPESSVLGIPVVWLALPKRIGLTADAGDAMRRWPGFFWPACGLALQGVERADISINLAAPRQKGGAAKGVLQRFAWGRKKGMRAAWGIDLGSTSLKAVRLTVDGDEQDAATVDQAVLIPHEKEVTRLGDTIQRREVFAATLRKFLDQHSPDNATVCLGLPSLSVLGRFFRLPPVDPKRLADAVAYEVRQQIPLPLDELVWDYHVWPLPEQEGDSGLASRIGVYAVKQFHVQEVEAICQEVGLKLDILSGNCIALHNLAVFELLGSEQLGGRAAPAVALLDVGAEGSALVVSSASSGWFRHLPVGGETVTGNLTRTFNLTRTQAEQVKSNPAKARRLKPLYEAIDPAIRHLADEIDRSLHQHAQLFQGVQIKHLFGLGGGFQLHGLLRRLRSGR
jgi:type IV pilus assembly protein PilM